MKCPRCNQELSKYEKFGIEVDFCQQCHGIWFDKNEIEQLSSKYPKFNFPEPEPSKMNIAKTQEHKFHCPRCNELMFKVLVAKKPPMIDYCPNGHGYWFDKNEFEQYVKNNLTWIL